LTGNQSIIDGTLEWARKRASEQLNRAHRKPVKLVETFESVKLQITVEALKLRNRLKPKSLRDEEIERTFKVFKSRIEI
jgi:hypothetical protein